ncbi:hypothetical protein SAMN05878482_104228 [Peribacillus simplex]|uniref:Uncharacterized protein n=1 Tax=Peribacillus simplex TaxID=1478 RepID=A0A9X8WL55_9BACI|nr:hypothetical protein SAMN05878482_104228 [Peribacillus simplex]
MKENSTSNQNITRTGTHINCFRTYHLYISNVMFCSVDDSQVESGQTLFHIKITTGYDPEEWNEKSSLATAKIEYSFLLIMRKILSFTHNWT